MIVLVYRDSVKSDDAPLPRHFEVSEDATLGEALRLVAKARYLPSIPGGRATWLVEGERPLAVMAQEHRDPWPLLPLGASLVQVAGRLPRPHLFFRHQARQNPEEVFRKHGGDPVRLPKEAWDPSPEISWTAALREFFN